MVRSGRGLASPTVLVFSIGLAIAMSGTSALAQPADVGNWRNWRGEMFREVRLTSQQQQLPNADWSPGTTATADGRKACGARFEVKQVEMSNKEVK